MVVDSESKRRVVYVDRQPAQSQDVCRACEAVRHWKAPETAQRSVKMASTETRAAAQDRAGSPSREGLEDYSAADKHVRMKRLAVEAAWT